MHASPTACMFFSKRAKNDVSGAVKVVCTLDVKSFRFGA